MAIPPSYLRDMAELYKYISDYLARPRQPSSPDRNNNSKEDDKTEQTKRRSLISREVPEKKIQT